MTRAAPIEAAFQPVPAVRQALAVLRHLADSPAPRGVNAVARGAGLSPSSCFNILKTLTAEGFVDFDPVTKAYALGPGVVALARRALDPAGAFTQARPALAALGEAAGATASLWRISADERMVLVGFVESDAGTRIHLTPGQRLPMLIGAGGRCIAAELGLSRAELRRRFAALRWEASPGFEAYARDVEAARARGWALDDGAYIRGVTSLAAAIADETGAVRFCVTCTLFHGRRDKALAAIGEETRRAAIQIRRRLYGIAEAGEGGRT